MNTFRTLFCKSKHSPRCRCISKRNGIVFILDQWIEPDAGFDTFQPMIPPAQHLMQEADLRVEQRKLRVGVSPPSDQALPRSSQLFEQARNGIGVAIGLAAGRCFGTSYSSFLQNSAGSRRPGGDDLDLAKQLEPHKLGNDEQH